ncbi:MAG: PQQ-binding-like beta-propeller repeat protein [Armatimonadota bacterium]|nr:MAG: PQQ-binding-like beta-propeller repeat protein [Armatimonadota bacterium]
MVFDVWSATDDVVVSWMPMTGGVPAHVTALNAETGQRRWSQPTGGRVCRATAVDRDELYCVLHGSAVWKIRMQDGAVLWRTTLALASGRCPAIDAHAVYAIDWEGSSSTRVKGGRTHARDGRLNALDRETGAVIWRREFQRSLVGIAAGHNDIYAAVSGGPLYSLQREDGATGWENDDIVCFSAPAVFGEHVVVPGLSSVFKVRADDGGIVWKQPLNRGRLVARGLTQAAEVVSVVDARGSLHALDLSTGTRLWKWSPPAKTESWRRPPYAWTADDNLVAIVGKPASKPTTADVVVIASQDGSGTEIGELNGRVSDGIAVRGMTVFVIVGERSVVALNVGAVNRSPEGDTQGEKVTIPIF